MKTITVISLLVSGALVFGGAGEDKESYTAKCQSCHGPTGEAKAAIAKMMNVTIKHLGSKEVQSKSDADLKKVILSGQGKMKAISGVTDKQADGIVSYVRTLKQ